MAQSAEVNLLLRLLVGNEHTGVLGALKSTHGQRVVRRWSILL